MSQEVAMAPCRFCAPCAWSQCQGRPPQDQTLPQTWTVVRVVAVLQRRQRHHGLEGRARRIGGGQRLVEQRLVVVAAPAPGTPRPVRPRTKRLASKLGRREHAQDVAVAAVHHHRRAALRRRTPPCARFWMSASRVSTISLPGIALMSPAGSWRTTRPLASTSTFWAPGLPRRSQVEGLLDALLADAEAGVEQDRVGVGAGRRQVGLVDLGHVADHVGEGAADRDRPAPRPCRR